MVGGTRMTALRSCGGHSAGFWIADVGGSVASFARLKSQLPDLAAVGRNSGRFLMRVFVAGATGAIGRELVPALKAAGHSVAGLTRSESRAETIKRAGALPVV